MRVKRIELIYAVEVHVEIDAISCLHGIVNVMHTLALIQQHQQDAEKRYVEAQPGEQVVRKVRLADTIDRACEQFGTLFVALFGVGFYVGLSVD